MSQGDMVILTSIVLISVVDCIVIWEFNLLFIYPTKLMYIRLLASAIKERGMYIEAVTLSCYIWFPTSYNCYIEIVQVQVRVWSILAK